MKDKEEKIKWLAITWVGSFFLYMLVAIAEIMNKERILDLNKRIEQLEKQSEKVHEYILNRIGG